ncbi:MAG: hypothetical protein HW411_865 [Gammaproteobacteria bacterium]|nr:hypothetical protein [Gammaproteobacteria bacterium]
MERLIIRQHRPVQLLMAVIIVCLLLSTTIWLFLDESHWSYIKSRYLAGQKSKELWEINRSLVAENKELQERVIMLERMTQIDGQTAAGLQEELKKLQDEIYILKGELEFYQGIMASTRVSQGLSIQGLQIEPLSQYHNYRFKLILTHVTKSDKLAEGIINIDLEGSQDGTAKLLNFKDVAPNEPLDLSFKFKNFKRVEGNMVLPDGFTPHRIIVRLHPKDGNLSKIERIFDWPEITSQIWRHKYYVG